MPRVCERYELEERAPFVLPAVRAREALMELEHLVCRVPARKAKELGEVADGALGCSRTGRSTADESIALTRADEAARDLDERRLAGAVRSEESDELAFFDREVDAAEGFDAAVSFDETADFESWRHAARVAALRL
jgi:hypothetical protein